MGAKASDKVLVTGQLMYLVDRLRNIQGFRIVKEYPDDKNNVKDILRYLLYGLQVQKM